MKAIFFIILIICLIFQTGCKHATEPAGPDIYVAFEVSSDFQNDLVKVKLDKEVLLNSRVTTNYTVSLAWSTGLQQLSRKEHLLHFAVAEYGVEKDYIIEKSFDTSTVIMRFDKTTNQIIIEQLKGRFLRD